MDIEAELKKLDRLRAIMVIAHTLRHFSNESTTLAIAATWTTLHSSERKPIFLIAPPQIETYEEERLDFLDDCCEEGACKACGVSLWSSFKSGLCPLCDAPVDLT